MGIIHGSIRGAERRIGGFGHCPRLNPSRFDVASYVGDMEYVRGLENPNEAIENAVRLAGEAWIL